MHRTLNYLIKKRSRAGLQFAFSADELNLALLIAQSYGYSTAPRDLLLLESCNSKSIIYLVPLAHKE